MSTRISKLSTEVSTGSSKGCFRSAGSRTHRRSLLVHENPVLLWWIKISNGSWGGDSLDPYLRTSLLIQLEVLAFGGNQLDSHCYCDG